MTTSGKMVTENPNIMSNKISVNLPSLNKVVALHLASLIITISLGIFLFLTQAPLILYILAIFLTGPIYAINLPYLFRYMEKTNSLVEKEIERLSIHEQKYTDLNKKNDSQSYKLISDRYLISKALNDLKEENISKRLFISLSLTPIWPVIFYHSKYWISKKIKVIEHIQEEIPKNKSLQHEKLNQKVELNGEGLFKTSFRHDMFFLIFSIISIIGFALTFGLIGVGFFAIFWIVLLHNKLSEDIIGLDEDVYTVKMKKRYITFSIFVSFLCFGATSGFIAAVSNTIYASIISPIGLVSPTGFMLFLVTVIAPLTEEPSKVAGFFFLDKDEAPKIPLFYWAFFGMVAGLGFALIEDYSYFQQFYLNYSRSDSIYLLILRLSNPVHLIGSALGGIGVGIWRKKKKLIYLVMFIFLAMVVHGSYNFLVSLGGA